MVEKNNFDKTLVYDAYLDKRDWFRKEASHVVACASNIDDGFSLDDYGSSIFDSVVPSLLGIGTKF